MSVVALVIPSDPTAPLRVIPSLKRYLVAAIGFAVSFAILFLLFKQAVDSDQFRLLVETPKQWGLLTLGLFAALSAISLTFVRWYYLVRALDLPFRMFDAFRLGFIGYFLNFFTVGIVGGDALKAIFLANQIPDRKTYAVASVVIDRIIGLFALFLLTTIATLLSGVLQMETEDPEQLNAVRVVCSIAIGFTCAGVVALIALQFADKTTPIMKRTLFRLPVVGPTFQRLHLAAVTYQSRQKTIFAAIVLSLGVHVLNSAAIFLIASGMPGSHPDFPSHLVIVPMSMVAGALPLPGGLGSFEFSLNFLYEGIAANDAESENGLIVAFGFRMVTLIMAAIGVVFYFAGRTEIRSLIEKAKSASSEQSDSRNQGDTKDGDENDGA